MPRRASRRRSLYFVHSHNEHNQFLSIFDDANVLECYRREESIVPQQALALATAATLEAAADCRALAAAGAALDVAALDDERFISVAFLAVLGNTPDADELRRLSGIARRLGQRASRATPAQTASTRRIHLVQALLNHNDFVTVR